MSEIIQDANGDDVVVFVKFSHGLFVDAIIRAKDKATWEAAAISQGLLADDPERGPVPVRGASIAAIGAVVLTPAVMDGETVVTPAVVDDRYHVNLRISEPMLSSVNSEGFEKWKVTAINWTTYGSDETGNKQELGKSLGDVTLIDPDTISSASCVWAGDQPRDGAPNEKARR